MGSLRSIVIKKALEPFLKALIDDTVKGILRSIGDAGTAPANVGGRTVLARLNDIAWEISKIRLSLSPRNAYNTSVGAPLSVTLDVSVYSNGRSHVEVCVKSSGTGVFRVYGSHDNARYWLVDTIDYPTANVDEHKGYLNAFPYIRVETDIVADNEILIVSSR